MHLVWFRHDLRVADHSALHAACTGDTPVGGVYLLCREQFTLHDTAPVQVQFLLAHLQALSAQLAALNIPLWLLDVPRWRDIPGALAAFAVARGAQALFFNDEYGVNEQRRDSAAANALQAAGIDVHRYVDQVLLAPAGVRTGNGEPYTVFTPFRRNCLTRLQSVPPQLFPVPAARRPPVLPAADPIPAQLSGCSQAFSTQDWPVGEAAAQARLQQFAAERIDAYAADRDRPDRPGTSRLSAYLALGVLSVRQCWLQAELARHDPRAAQGAETWQNELLWREFYKHLLAQIPRLSMHRAFKRETERLPWRDDATLLRAWQEGNTGIPIVDAAMRCLNDSGWMHNRLRMIVASFFSKNLFLDWRLGEQYFMRQLIDGDFAANNGGWQWSASVGTDAAPYFRIFNPVLQAQKFDPQGEFIRTWVQELKNEPASRIHQIGARGAYRAPIIDLQSSRQHTLAAFQGLQHEQRYQSQLAL